MELIRNWLIGVTAAALIAALADSLSPEGAVKRIGKLAGGLLMLVAILKPLAGAEFSALSGVLADYQIQTELSGSALESENERLMKIIIEEQTAAYIQDKAAELGAVCTAEVNCAAGENGTLIPVSAVIYGMLTLEQETTLRQMIADELAIPKESQQYERTKNS